MAPDQAPSAICDIAGAVWRGHRPAGGSASGDPCSSHPRWGNGLGIARWPRAPTNMAGPRLERFELAEQVVLAVPHEEPVGSLMTPRGVE